MMFAIEYCINYFAKKNNAFSNTFIILVFMTLILKLRGDNDKMKKMYFNSDRGLPGMCNSMGSAAPTPLLCNDKCFFFLIWYNFGLPSHTGRRYYSLEYYLHFYPSPKLLLNSAYP